jgi:hypothetical protein
MRANHPSTSHADTLPSRSPPPPVPAETPPDSRALHPDPAQARRSTDQQGNAPDPPPAGNKAPKESYEETLLQSLQRRNTLSYWRRQLYGFDRQSTISEESRSRSRPSSAVYEGVDPRQSRTESMVSGGGTPPRLTSESSYERDADASPAGQALGLGLETRGDDAALVSGALMFVDEPPLRSNPAHL